MPLPDPWHDNLRDGGPVYTETLHNWDTYEAGNWHVIEWCNAITALAFVVIVVVWLVRLRGQYRAHPFVLTGMAILLVGGIGGTIYHAFRKWPFFLAMDVVPIALLCAIASIYLWVRLRPRWYYVAAAILAVVAVNGGDYFVRTHRHLAIIINYLSLTALIVVPLIIVLVRTRFRHSNWIKLGVVCFGFAILFRFLDPILRQLPTGTHFIWHLGGAATTYCLTEYFYRIETEPLSPLPIESRAAMQMSQAGD